MATAPNPAEINRRLDRRRFRLEQTFRLLRLQIQSGLDWREQAARHWKATLITTAVTGFFAGRLIGRLFRRR